MRAVLLSLAMLQDPVAGILVVLMSDNSAAVTYLNKQGGTISLPLHLSTAGVGIGRTSQRGASGKVHPHQDITFKTCFLLILALVKSING